MFRSHELQSGTALLIALGLTTGASLPLVSPYSALAQTSFPDVPSNYWAQEFIQKLATRDIIKGFPDGSFRPNEPVTRAQFAAMVNKAFNQPQIRNNTNFVDVPSKYWAATAIGQAYRTGFMAGYPGNIFNPGQNIPRVQVLVSLSNGLKYSSSAPTETVLPQFYNDAASIPNYARNSVAAATENRIVVNYPNIKFLNPNQTATRADVAAFIYQALNRSGQVGAVASPYIVGQTTSEQPSRRKGTIPAGTSIAVGYEKERILVAPDETAPLTLTVKENIIISQKKILIPLGSQIVGELRPAAKGGTRFVAKELVFPNGQRTPINANSKVVTTTEEVRKGIKVGTVLRNTALGAAAAAALAAVTGDHSIKPEEVLGGAGIGALIGVFMGRDKVTLISINPNTDLTLTLKTDLEIERSNN